MGTNYQGRERRSLRSFFPRGLVPREGQVQVFEEIERVWDKSDVIVIEAPTAAGKSHIIKTLAKWAAQVYKVKSHIIVPTNILVAQMTEDGTFSLKKKHEYTCAFPLEGRTFSCEEGQKDSCHGKYCSGCPYVKDLRRARAMPYQVSNYYTYMAHKLYTPVLIVDEAHGLVGMLRDLSSKKLWYRDYKYPHNVRTYAQLLNWATEALAERPQDKKLQTLYKDLISGRNQYIVEKAVEKLRGHDEPLLKLLPIDTSDSPPVLWPGGKVNKIILLSATIGRKDVEQMGLENRRVSWIRVPSPIDAWRRPFIHDPVVKLHYGSEDSNYVRLAEYCDEVLRLFPGKKGLVHMPYALVDKVQNYLKEDRYLFHNRFNKQEKFKEFSESTDKVLVCSGLYEGVDLPGDAGRFQILAKIPWPSLGDPAMRHLAETDRERYQWDTLRVVIQATGRICRLVDDVGYSFCPDASFTRLPESLYPVYFKDAITAGRKWKEINPPPGEREGKVRFYI